MNNTTTISASGKVARRRRAKLPLPPKKKPYSRRELAAEVEKLTHEVYDPAYLADIANGNRVNGKLAPVLKQAISNLESRPKPST